MEEKKKRSYYNREHQLRYQHSGIKKVSLSLTRTKDADIIAKLESVDSAQGYIKKVIRDDIAREGL